MGRIEGLRYLLDTHILLGSVTAPERLKPAVLEVMRARTSELWLSSMSVWEILT